MEMQLKAPDGVKTKQIEALILNCNKLAMEHLKTENYQASLHLLRRAHDLLTGPSSLSDNDLLAITLNNMGCYYKKLGKLALSLQFLQKALDLDPSKPSSAANMAGTHLNMCSIKSQLGNHEAALVHAQQAWRLLEDNPAAQMTKVIALHSIGVELESLRQHTKALDAYKRGLDIASAGLGSSHHLTETLRNSYAALARTQHHAAKRRSYTSSPHRETGLPKIKPGLKEPRRMPVLDDFAVPKRPSVRTASTSKKYDTRQGVRRPRTFHFQQLKAADKREIETKLKSLQEQLNTFEKKYESLELKHHRLVAAQHTPVKAVHDPRREAKSVSLDAREYYYTGEISAFQPNKNLAAITIQKHWRGYRQREAARSLNRARAKERAQLAIQELENLKKLAQAEDYFKVPEVVRPMTNAATSAKTRFSGCQSALSRLREQENKCDVP